MTVFLMAAGALVLLALALIVPPFFKSRGGEAMDRDSQNATIAKERLAEMEADLKNGVITRATFDQGRKELELTLSEDLNLEADETATGSGGRWAVVLVIVAVPALAAFMYQQLGTPQALDPQFVARATPAKGHGSAGGQPGQQVPSVEELVETLAARLEQEPDNPQGWFMLARSYMSLRRFSDAAAALEKLNELEPDNANVLVSYADALAMTNGGQMRGKPYELINQALAIEPNHGTGLWLAGMAETELGNDAAALEHWRKLLPQLADNPESAAELRSLMAKAEQRLGIEPTVATAAPVAAPVAAAPAPAAAGANVTVSVSLAPELAEQLSPTDTLFIYARAMSGPPMPLAAVRKQAKDLPITVTLDDTMAMMPQMKLSGFPQVKINARISRTGNAIPQSGDLMGEVSPVATGGGEQVQVVINQRLP